VSVADAKQPSAQELLDNNIVSFRRKRDVNRKIAFSLKLLTVAIGAAATILLGLKA